MSLSESDQLILHVAYMLINVDGKMCELEKEAFFKFAHLLEGFDHESQNTMIGGVFVELQNLMEWFDVDERAQAFVKFFTQKVPQQFIRFPE